jgi:putative hemolysin
MDTASNYTQHDVACRSDTSLVEAARLMRDCHVGDLIVVDGTAGLASPVGILTDRDAVLAVVSAGVDSATLFVGEAMSSPARCVCVGKSLASREPDATTQVRATTRCAPDARGWPARHDIANLASSLCVTAGHQPHFEEKRRA